MTLKHFSLIIAIALVFASASCSDDTEHAFAPDDDTQPDPIHSRDSDESPEPGTESDDPERKTGNPENSTPEPQQLSKVSRLGGLSPEDALEYMESTPDLVIVQVTPEENKLDPGFIGAMYIPYTELEMRYDEIPREVPVILHCRRGKASVPAYEILCEKRPDIPELSYIAGEPLVDAYNAWFESINQAGEPES